MLFTKTMSHSLSRQHGVTLIEALVSLLIFSIGALGIAALQTTTLVRSDDTKQRSIVIWKAQDLIDRMKSTKTANAPAGQMAAYSAALVNLGGQNNTNGIGVANTPLINCPVIVPARCSDNNGDDETAPLCTVQQAIDYDMWEVFCDPNTGLARGVNLNIDGYAGVQDLEVALTQQVFGGGTEYFLYFEWLARSADKNIDTDGDAVDTGIQAAAGAGAIRTATTNLCGQDEDIDTRLDTYCVRFK